MRKLISSEDDCVKLAPVIANTLPRTEANSFPIHHALRSWLRYQAELRGVSFHRSIFQTQSGVRVLWLMNYGKPITRNQSFVKMTKNDCNQTMVREARVQGSPSEIIARCGNQPQLRNLKIAFSFFLLFFRVSV